MVWNDLAVVGTLTLIEGLLSADNAIVLAVLVRHLPKKQRNRALRYGVFGAFFFRGVCLLAATWLIKAWYFQVGGALYLIWVGAKHLIEHDAAHHHEEKKAKQMSFWKTVLMVELTDVAFSIDSILAAVAMSDKMWVVYLGGIMGIVAMRFVAGIFLRLLDRFPGLALGAYALVVWIGLKLLIHGWTTTANTLGPGWGWSAAQIEQYTFHMPEALFWLGMAVIGFVAFVWPNTSRSKSKVRS